MVSIQETFRYTHLHCLPELPSIDGLLELLLTCREHRDFPLAHRLHHHICFVGLDIHKDVGNYVVHLLGECGSLPAAVQGFKRLASRNYYSYTALMLGFIRCEQWQNALDMYHDMQVGQVCPSSYTFVVLLKACAGLKDAEKGQEIHAEVARIGHDGCVYVGTTLVDMYAECGLLTEARYVIDMLPSRNVASWNALIAGYAKYGTSVDAVNCLEKMRLDGIYPDIITFVCILKACSNRGAIGVGQGIHLELTEQGHEMNSIAGNILVDMYARHGFMTEARRVFDQLPTRDLVSWTALIAGYAEHGPFEEALSCFEQLQLEHDVFLDAAVFACILKACGNIGAIEKGLEVLTDLYTKGIEINLHIGSTLVGMYAKCGRLTEAREVLDKLPERNVVSWNAMINGHGLNEDSNLVIEVFEDMQKEGVKPDAITFSCLLSACSRASLVHKGQEYFKMMRDYHGISPTVWHLMCIVDLFARSGRLCEACKFLESLPHQPSAKMWTALMNACKTYEEAEAGQRCFDQLVQPHNSMGTLYFSMGTLNDSWKVEEQKKHSGAMNLLAYTRSF